MTLPVWIGLGLLAIVVGFGADLPLLAIAGVLLVIVGVWRMWDL